MKSAPHVHAIGDRFFTDAKVDLALASVRTASCPITTSVWQHATLEDYRHDLLAFEVSGPAAVANHPDYAAMAGLAQAEILIVQFCPVSQELFSLAPNLQLIGVIRAGVENIDLNAAQTASVRVINTIGRNAQAVAEFTMGMLLTELHNIARADAKLKQGQWVIDYPGCAERHELHGHTVGIIGAGEVGIRTAALLTGFACRILMHDPFKTEFPAHVEVTDLDTLLATADHVIVHARLTKDNRGMIGSRELGLMKSNAVLVNTARAGLVDVDALAVALQEGRIGGAAIDVHSSEPLAADYPLLKCPNVTLTPHFAGLTVEANSNGPLYMSGYLRDYLAGDRKSLPYIV